ncbi:condensation domain-containing protein [Nonomuraea fuscirosea]|uniref:condensation domain-containing protein n=1 Tax=Nonomuraea fuscirosea TaxID=1291556 RepID=UPI003419CC33
MASIGVVAAQESLWLAQRLRPDPPNNVAAVWDVEGELDRAALNSALRAVLTEARTVLVNFREEAGRLRQEPRDLGAWQPFAEDLSGAADPEAAARAYVAELAARPFDLERDVLFRAGLLTLGEQRSFLVLVCNHVVTDAFGLLTLVSRRIAEVYTAMRKGDPAPGWPVEEPAALHERDARYRASDRFARDAEFWRRYLPDTPAPARLPGTPAPASAGADAGRTGVWSHTARVPRHEADAWQGLAGSYGVTLPTLLMAAAAVFFRHMCDLPEPLFTVTVNNRFGATRRTPGVLSNLVPIKIEVPVTAGLPAILDATQRAKTEVFRHATHQVSDIQRETGRAGAVRSPDMRFWEYDSLVGPTSQHRESSWWAFAGFRRVTMGESGSLSRRRGGAAGLQLRPRFFGRWQPWHLTPRAVDVIGRGRFGFVGWSTVRAAGAPIEAVASGGDTGRRTRSWTAAAGCGM